MMTMRALIDELPAQLRWAAEARVPDVPPATEAVVAGMGGSGIAGAIAAVIADRAGRRVSVHRCYGLPGWAAAHRPLVVAVSHSGNTEETVSAAEEAAAGGMDLAVVTAGGRLAGWAEHGGRPVLRIPAAPQPRAAVGRLAGGTLRLLEAAGVLPPQGPGLLEAAAVVEDLLRGPGPALAADIAAALERRVAVVYGGHGIGEVAAGRWKTQINENGKAPAFSGVLPELDHNEVVGWTAWPDLSVSGIGIVWLHDPADHPRVEMRAEITRRLLEDRVTVAGEVYAAGEGPLARLFGLMVIGDLVSVAIAERAGVDPMQVEAIDDLKARLEET